MPISADVSEGVGIQPLIPIPVTVFFLYFPM